jgi:hypothetical protein
MEEEDSYNLMSLVETPNGQLVFEIDEANWKDYYFCRMHEMAPNFTKKECRAMLASELKVKADRMINKAISMSLTGLPHFRRSR